MMLGGPSGAWEVGGCLELGLDEAVELGQDVEPGCKRGAGGVHLGLGDSGVELGLDWR